MLLIASEVYASVFFLEAIGVVLLVEIWDKCGLSRKGGVP